MRETHQLSIINSCIQCITEWAARILWTKNR